MCRYCGHDRKLPEYGCRYAFLCERLCPSSCPGQKVTGFARTRRSWNPFATGFGQARREQSDRTNDCWAIKKLIKELQDTYEPERTVVAGDGLGGSLALNMACECESHENDGNGFSIDQIISFRGLVLSSADSASQEGVEGLMMNERCDFSLGEDEGKRTVGIYFNQDPDWRSQSSTEPKEGLFYEDQKELSTDRSKPESPSPMATDSIDFKVR